MQQGTSIMKNFAWCAAITPYRRAPEDTLAHTKTLPLWAWVMQGTAGPPYLSWYPAVDGTTDGAGYDPLPHWHRSLRSKADISGQACPILAGTSLTKSCMLISCTTRM